MTEKNALLVALVLAGLGIHCRRPPSSPARQGSSPASVPGKPQLLPPAREGELPCDSKDQQPVLLGPATRAAILAHRSIFQANTDKANLPPALLKRWKDLATPCTLVVAFGSWCGDSQRELPDFLALMAEENPFVKVQFLGVYRDKKVAPGLWPPGLEPQTVANVPTFWLYVLQPGGSSKLLGSVVETPPKKGQRMAEAVLELLEKAN